jgi:guanosine-3',5'-bis(diphosphate) 3'-pyrophosphohydrolase
LARVAGVQDLEVLAAAVLHDVVEDTEMTVGELKEQFGERVAGLVAECTDDKTLPKEERKRLQVEHAAYLSKEARLIKLADKTSNVGDVVETDWEAERITAYLDWAEAVAKGLKGVNGALDEVFERALAGARGRLGARERRAK